MNPVPSESESDSSTDETNVKYKVTKIDENSNESSNSDTSSESENESDSEQNLEITSRSKDKLNVAIGEEGLPPQPSQSKVQSDDEFAQLRSELTSMPFDDLQRLKEKIGIKLYNQVMFGKGSAPGQRKFKRENKNRPMEISSKVRPRRLRQVVSVKKRMVRDPRFDDLSGSFREDIFKKTYSFIDDIKKNEKQKIKTKLKKERNEERKEDLQELYKSMTAKEKAEKQKDVQKEREREHRRQERAMLAEGKTPYFMKNSDKKKLELAEKFRDLKRKGKVEQYMSKKRKKNASKEKRNLPALSQ